MPDISGGPVLTASTRRSGSRLTLKLGDTGTGAAFLLVGIHKATATDGCTAEGLLVVLSANEAT